MSTIRTVTIVGSSLLTATVTAGITASPAAATSHKPPVVQLKGSSTAVKANKGSVHAGVVQFKVAKTQPADPVNGPDSITVFSAKKIDKVLAQIPKLFSQDPNAGPTAAAAVAYLNEHATIYGGGHKGTTWQVSLSKGTYYAVSINSAGVGNPMMYKFSVKGKPGSSRLHKTGATVTAAKPNVFKTRGLHHLGKAWLKFRNTSKELHFMDMTGVKADTTNKQVQEAFQSPTEPDFFTKQAFAFDVISPGVEVAIKGPVKPGRYLLDCFIPSEIDGMPHALMGMWKLVDVA